MAIDHDTKKDESFLNYSEAESLGFIKFPLPILLDERLDFVDKILWCLLCRFCDAEGKCYPSVERLSEGLGLERRSVFSHLLKLESVGLLTRQKRQGRSTVYVLRALGLVYDDQRGFLKDEAFGSLCNVGESNRMKTLLQDREVRVREKVSGVAEYVGGRLTTETIVNVATEMGADVTMVDTDKVKRMATEMATEVVTGEVLGEVRGMCQKTFRKDSEEEFEDEDFEDEDSEDEDSEEKFERLMGAVNDNLRSSKKAAKKRVESRIKRQSDAEFQESVRRYKQKKKMEKPLNVRDVETAWMIEVRKIWPNNISLTAPWTLANKGIAKRFIRLYGAECTIDTLTGIIQNWDEYVERYGITGYPNLRVISGYSETWFSEFELGNKQPMTPKEKALSEREYDEKNSAKQKEVIF